MNVGFVGTGPAVESLSAALADVDATVEETAAADLGEFDFGAVVGATGADAFDVASETAERWVAVEIGGVGGRALAGVDAAVSVFGAESGCYRCLRRRVAAAAEGAGADRKHGVRSAVRFAGALAGRRAVQSLSGDPVAGTVVEVPGPKRAFLPVPGCQCTGDDERPQYRDVPLDYRDAPLADALDRAERAVDERVGVVRQVGERDSYPVPYYLARLADTDGFSDARAAELAAGVDPDWDAAFMKAIGEALERYAAGVYRESAFRTAPPSALASAVEPSRFVRPEGYEAPDPDDAVAWVPGVELGVADSAPVVADRPWLPAEFVHYPPAVDRYRPAITTGLGLGNSGVEATLSGLYEVLERDATMLGWYSSFEPLGLTVDDETFDALGRRAHSEDLAVTTLLVTQDVDVPVVAAAVHREGAWPRFAVGSSADLDATAAARGALAEALQNWMELRAMGPEAAAEEKAAIGEYADFPPAARAFVAVDDAVPAGDVGPETVPTGEAELAAVLDRAADAGLDAYAARLTTRDLDRLGFEAARVVVPTAQPLFTAEPFFGERARSVPGDLGFEPRLDREYHPYP